MQNFHIYNLTSKEQNYINFELNIKAKAWERVA